MAPALGGEGLAMLKTRLEAESTTPPKTSDRKVIAITTRGPIQREDFEARYKARRIQSALTDIADALGDADGYAARYSDEERSNPAIAAQIAERLLRADRPDDAMATLELAEPQTRGGRHWPDWHRVWIDTLEALAGPMRPRAPDGRSSSATSTPIICAPTSSAFPISTMKRPKTGHWPMCASIPISIRHSIS
jgi:hypothetical protein